MKYTATVEYWGETPRIIARLVDQSDFHILHMYIITCDTTPPLVTWLLVCFTLFNSSVRYRQVLILATFSQFKVKLILVYISNTLTGEGMGLG